MVCAEGVKRLKEDGHQVIVVDSEGVLSEEQVKGNKRLVVNDTLEHYLAQFEEKK